MNRRLFIWLGVLALLFRPDIGHVDEHTSAREHDIQAAFLVKFTRYIKWPEKTFSGGSDPIIIGIYGRDPFGSSLDYLARTTVGEGRPILVKRFSEKSEFASCHILYVGSAEVDKLPDIVEAIEGKPICLVGDTKGLLDNAGIIKFIKLDNKLRFSISRTNAEKAGLQISSKLLKVAHKVK